MRRLAVFSFCALGACGGTGAADDARVVAAVDTVDGVERLSYAAEPAGDLEWSTDTVAVLGDAFADDAYQFDEVTTERLASDRAGNLYVLDRQGHRVLKYGPEGGHLATYGRDGRGPGELNQPMGLTLGAGDTIWVSDFSNGRLTGYPQDGGDPRLIPFEEGRGIPSPGMAAVDGSFVMMFRPLFNFRRGPGGMAMSRGDDDGAADDARRLPLLRVDGSLTPLDTVWRTTEPPMDMVQLESGNNVIITMMSREFWPEFQWRVFSDGGAVVADSAAYVLQFLDPEGSVRRKIRRSPAPRPSTEADRELVRQRLREQSQEGGGIRMGGGGPDEETRQRMLEQRLEKMTFADVIPQVVGLRVDPSDRLWVGVAEEAPDSVSRIDVFDRDGALLGELRDFPLPDVFLGANRIGVLRRDEMDVQQVVLMDIRRGATDMASR